MPLLLRRSPLALLFLLAVVPRLDAQVPFEACLDRQLRPIPGRVDNKIGYGAMAGVENGGPIIIWNQHNLSQASGTFQLFLYLHECAHHNLNHVTKVEGRKVEDQADCWAWQLMVDGDMVGGRHVTEITREFKRRPGDADHLGGEELLRWLSTCLQLRTNRVSWSAALDTLTAAAHDGFSSLRGQPIAFGAPNTFEVTTGTPGTFDCELIQPPAVRCMVFVTRKEKDAQKRFDMLREIIGAWFPAGWSVVPHNPADAGLTQSFVARDTTAGTIMILGRTPQNRIYFMLKAPKS
jgi:hypothetical protein